MLTQTRVIAPVPGQCEDEDGAFGVVTGRSGDMVLVVFPDEPRFPVYPKGEGKQKSGDTMAWRWVNEQDVLYL